MFKKLFKKKPGGTFVGNLLRGVGDNFTGGIYSKVFKAPDANSGGSPSRLGTPHVTVTPPATGPTPGYRSTTPMNDRGGSNRDKKNILKEYGAYIAGGALALALTIWAIVSNNKGGGRRRRKKY
ncbi:MAG: hypothetical protein MI974_19045 [Chitinophagales bacterium]|nr:hypothetical protein [Chitinophagales bacterium]